MNIAALRRASLGLIGLAMAASCVAGGPAADEGVAVRPPLPTTLEEHSEQLALVSEALNQDPMDPEYRQWAEELNAISDAWTGLFYSFKTDQGSTIKLYEPEPGMYMAAERAPHGAEMSLGRQAWEMPGELYAQLKPGTPLPEEIAAADARHEALLANPTRSTELDGEPETASVDPVSSDDASGEYVYKHASSCADFRDTHGFCRNGTGGGWCVCDIPGNSTGNRPSMTHSFHRISMVTGNVSVNFQVGSLPRSGFALLQGEEWFFEFFSTIRTVTGSSGGWGYFSPAVHWKEFQKLSHFAEVFGPSSAVYHWGACFDNLVTPDGWTCPNHFPIPSLAL